MDNLNLVFSIATHQDASEIAELVNRAYRPEPGTGGWTHEANLIQGFRTSKEQVVALMRSGSVVLILRRAHLIVACVQVSHADTATYIGMLASHPRLQGFGYGSLMLKEAERYASFSAGTKMLQISVIEIRTELIAFYEKRGYRRTGIAYPYPLTGAFGMPVVNGIMVLDMTKAIRAPASPHISAIA